MIERDVSRNVFSMSISVVRKDQHRFCDRCTTQSLSVLDLVYLYDGRLNSLKSASFESGIYFNIYPLHQAQNKYLFKSKYC